jgi:hypothetical protein
MDSLRDVPPPQDGYHATDEERYANAPMYGHQRDQSTATMGTDAGRYEDSRYDGPAYEHQQQQQQQHYEEEYGHDPRYAAGPARA